VETGAFFARRVSNTKVTELDVALGGHEDIVGRNVAMDDLKGEAVVSLQRMGVAERIQELARDVGRHSMAKLWHLALQRGAKVGECDAIHPLHDDVATPELFAEVERLHDVAVRQKHRKAGFGM